MVVLLAVIGALLVTAGSWSRVSRFLGRGGITFVVRLGYGVTGLSVLLFIIAGFIVH